MFVKKIIVHPMVIEQLCSCHIARGPDQLFLDSFLAVLDRPRMTENSAKTSENSNVTQNIGDMKQQFLRSSSRVRQSVASPD